MFTIYNIAIVLLQVLDCQKEGIMDKKKSIKRQRTRMFFLDAVKELIVSEGVEAVSVRRVADAAGYSFATLYKYFADLNELLWDAKQEMILDLVEIMQKNIRDYSLDRKGLKDTFSAYIGYYLENPKVFQFFYFHKLDQPEGRDTEPGPDFDKMAAGTFQDLVREGKLKESEAAVVARTCIYAIHGLLTLFFSGNGNLTEEVIFEELNAIIDYLLQP